MDLTNAILIFAYVFLENFSASSSFDFAACTDYNYDYYYTKDVNSHVNCTNSLKLFDTIEHTCCLCVYHSFDYCKFYKNIYTHRIQFPNFLVTVRTASFNFTLNSTDAGITLKNTRYEFSNIVNKKSRIKRGWFSDLAFSQFVISGVTCTAALAFTVPTLYSGGTLLPAYVAGLQICGAATGATGLITAVADRAGL